MAATAATGMWSSDANVAATAIAAVEGSLAGRSAMLASGRTPLITAGPTTTIWMPFVNPAGLTVPPGEVVWSAAVSPQLTLNGALLTELVGVPRAETHPARCVWVAPHPGHSRAADAAPSWVDQRAEPVEPAASGRPHGVATGRSEDDGEVTYVEVVVAGRATLSAAHTAAAVGDVVTAQGLETQFRARVLVAGPAPLVAVLPSRPPQAPAP